MPCSCAASTTSGGGGPSAFTSILTPGCASDDLDLARALRVDVQARGLDDAAVELVGGSGGTSCSASSSLDELRGARAGIMLVEVREARLGAAALAHVLRGHDDVDAVGLAVDVLVDPVELDLELRRA